MRLKKGKSSYKLPKNYYEINSVILRNGNKLSYSSLRYQQYFAYLSQGRPQLYSISSGAITFNPTPDKAYYVDVFYTEMKRA